MKNKIKRIKNFTLLKILKALLKVSDFIASDHNDFEEIKNMRRKLEEKERRE